MVEPLPIGENLKKVSLTDNMSRNVSKTRFKILKEVWFMTQSAGTN